MNLQELLQLSEKFGQSVVVSEDGEVKGIMLSPEKYIELVGQKKLSKQQLQKDIAEEVNRQIIKAQLEEVPVTNSDVVINSQGLNQANLNLETVNESTNIKPSTSQSPNSLGDLITKKAEELFMDQPFGRSSAPAYDLREEVIDQDFGKNIPPNQTTLQTDFDDEEIQTNFENI